MGKKARSEAKKKRASIKRARKATMQAQYKAWADSGQNLKSKRNRLRSRRKAAIRTVSHRDGSCGNLGCQKCHSEIPATAYSGSSVVKEKPWKTSREKLAYQSNQRKV